MHTVYMWCWESRYFPINSSSQILSLRPLCIGGNNGLPIIKKPKRERQKQQLRRKLLLPATFLIIISCLLVMGWTFLDFQNLGFFRGLPGFKFEVRFWSNWNVREFVSSVLAMIQHLFRTSIEVRTFLASLGDSNLIEVRKSENFCLTQH